METISYYSMIVVLVAVPSSVAAAIAFWFSAPSVPVQRFLAVLYLIMTLAMASQAWRAQRLTTLLIQSEQEQKTPWANR